LLYWCKRTEKKVKKKNDAQGERRARTVRSLYLLYWCKSTSKVLKELTLRNVREEESGQGRYSLYHSIFLLYWYKSTTKIQNKKALAKRREEGMQGALVLSNSIRTFVPVQQVN
jgi:hypothetical protein